MNDIKLYEELSYIYTFDDKVYPTPIGVSDLERVLNWSNKFLNLGTDLIAVSSIKRVEGKKVWSIENALLQIKDSDLRDKMSIELQKRKAEWKTINMEIFQNIFNRLTDQTKWE